MTGKGAYMRRLEWRESCSRELQRKPIPPGYIGLIVEVNTSEHWCVERPQLVLGNLEEHARLRVKPGYTLTDGPQAFQVVREEVFIEYLSPLLLGKPLLTVYTDERLDREVARGY